MDCHNLQNVRLKYFTASCLKDIDCECRQLHATVLILLKKLILQSTMAYSMRYSLFFTDEYHFLFRSLPLHLLLTCILPQDGSRWPIVLMCRYSEIAQSPDHK